MDDGWTDSRQGVSSHIKAELNLCDMMAFDNIHVLWRALREHLVRDPSVVNATMGTNSGVIWLEARDIAPLWTGTLLGNALIVTLHESINFG